MTSDLAFALVKIILILFLALAGWEEIHKITNP